MHKIKYTRYPNNEIRAVHYYSADKKSTQPSSDGEICCDSLSGVASPSEGEEEKTPPNFLTLAPISDSTQANLPFRRTKFGSNAKNTILRIGGSYDTLSTNPHDFVFLTGTLPGNNPAAFRAIAEYSSDIAESVGHWIKRTVKSDHYFYVWELQKRGALHFHYCVYCPDIRVRQIVLDGFKPKWTALLDSISEKSNVCLWESSNATCHRDRYGTLQAYAQEIHTSVAAYLCGYLGGAKNKHVQDESSPYYPRRWWGASRASTNLLKSLTEQVIVEHTNYRDARKEMLLHYETVLHESPKVHKYNHLVGIGSTIISYSPEDKGDQTWQRISKMTLTHKHHPNISLLIHLCSKLAIMTACYVGQSETLKRSARTQLLRDLEDFTRTRSTQRYILRDSTLRMLRTVQSQLPLPCDAKPHLNECWRLYGFLNQLLLMNQGKFEFNQHGYLANTYDLPHTVDTRAEILHLSTTDPEEGEATPGAANGSISPQNPLPSSQLCLFSDS